MEGFSSNDSTNTANTNTSNNNNGIRNNNIKSPSQSSTRHSNPISPPKASIPSLQTLCTTVVWKNLESYDFEALLLMEDSNINYNSNRSGSEGEVKKNNNNNWMQWLISSLIDSKNHKLLQRSDEVINKSE